jgi:hypothetical protein
MHSLLGVRVVEDTESHSHVDAVELLRTGDGEAAEAIVLFGLSFDVVLEAWRQSRPSILGTGSSCTDSNGFGCRPNHQGQELEGERHGGFGSWAGRVPETRMAKSSHEDDRQFTETLC